MPTLQENLEFIRKTMDMAVADDIESIKGKGSAVAGILGLSAECKKNAKVILEQAKVKAYLKLKEDKLQPSVLMKMIDAECSEEIGDYVYADRLNAGLTHQLEYLRSLFSYNKQEMINEYNASRSNLNT